MTDPDREIATVIGRPSGIATMMTMIARVRFSMSFLTNIAPFLSLSEKPVPRKSIMREVAKITRAPIIPRKVKVLERLKSLA